MNELETVVFHDYNIMIQSNESGWSDKESVGSIEEELEDPEDVLSDIYSDQHRWDTIVPYLSFRFRPDIWCEYKSD
jgi:hypothetical protein